MVVLGRGYVSYDRGTPVGCRVWGLLQQVRFHLRRRGDAEEIHCMLKRTGLT